MNSEQNSSPEQRQDTDHDNHDVVTSELRSLAIDSSASAGSPECVTASGFTTPKKQRPKTKDWSDYRLSPLKKDKTIADAIAQARINGFFEEHFDKTPKKFRCILFLYGTGYFDAFTKEERISAILEFIDKGSVRRRLMRIAFSPPCDAIPDIKFEGKHKEFFERYCIFATSCKRLFDNKNSSEGPPGTPYYRIQRSSVCYIVSVAMFLYLNMRKQDENQKPIDVGWLARHYVINTLELLRKRVIDDEGGGTLELLKAVVGNNFYKKAVLKIESDQHKDHIYASEVFKTNLKHIKAYLDRGNYGLVSTFAPPDEWNEAQLEDYALKKPGYWLFDQPSEEGTYVEFDVDEGSREEYRKLWDKELNDAKSIDTTSVVQEKYESQMPKQTTTKHSLHAMVLIGYIERNKGETKETLLVLQNWWDRMPLIVMTFEYMAACEANVVFLKHKLPLDVLTAEQKVCGLLGAECSHPDYPDTHYYYDDVKEGDY